MKREELKEIINKTNGTFFSVTFIKKNGEKRKMNARRGVKSYLKGGVNKVETEDHPEYMTVFEIPKKQYRTINLDTIISIHANGKVYNN